MCRTHFGLQGKLLRRSTRLPQLMPELMVEGVLVEALEVDLDPLLSWLVWSRSQLSP